MAGEDYTAFNLGVDVDIPVGDAWAVEVTLELVAIYKTGRSRRNGKRYILGSTDAFVMHMAR